MGEKKKKLNESRRQELGRASKGEIDVPMAFGLYGQARGRASKGEIDVPMAFMDRLEAGLVRVGRSSCQQAKHAKL